MKMTAVLAVLLLFAGLAAANDLSLVFTDSIVPADSADERADTAYTSAVMLDPSLGRFQFYSKIEAYSNKDDTNWTDDTFFVKLQKSVDGQTWTTSLEIDTFLTNGESFSPLNVSVSDSVYGYYVRGMVVHWDSIGAGEADSALVNRDAPFYKKVWIWVTQWGQ